MALVIAAYLPAVRGQFIWDDDFHIIKSAPLRSLSGLWRIWFEPGATQQYYPLTHSSFWLDYHLWGLHPMAYHVENILLHGLGAVLVWRVLRRLGVRGAWLGAALFALHPVCVESVAWITERKNTLSGVCFLSAILMAIEFWLPRQAIPAKKGEKENDISKAAFGPWKFYWLALFLYLCALWCKTATVGLPGVLLLLAWWKRGRLMWKDGILVLPFLALGLGMALITVSIEHQFILTAANAEEWQLSLLQRCLIAGRGFWFYLGKLCWPHPLMFVYPRWQVEAGFWQGYLSLGAAGAGFFVLWRKCHVWARPVLVAAGYFVIMLFPALGFFNVFPFRYSFVADHFQYLAAIGPLALAAAGITFALGHPSNKKTFLKPALSGALLLLLGMLTWRQTGIYYNLETLWRDTLARNPEAWMAHDNLGIYLSETGHFEEADSHYRKAIELRPNDHLAYYDLGLESAMQGNLEQAAIYFDKTLEICPGYALANYQFGNVLARKGDLDEAISEYKKALHAIPSLAVGHYNLANALARKGKQDEAIEEYIQTLKMQPDYAPAQASLGRIFAAKGDLDKAIIHLRVALEYDPNSLDALANLGNALVAQGQLEDAVSYYRTALRLAPKSHIIHYNLSVALTRQGKAAEAQAEWAEAKRLESEHSSSR